MPTTDARRDRVDSMMAFITQLEPGRDVTAKSVAWRLRRAAHYVDTEVRRRLAQEGMELWEMEILCALRRASGSLTMGDLQDIAQLTSGAITNRVARLENDGHVRREMDPGDRRQVLVTITPSGLLRAEQVVAANNSAEQAILGDLDPGVQKRLAHDLRDLLLALEGPDPRT